MIKKIGSIAAIAAAGLLLVGGTAIAQDSTSGAVRGQVKDRANGETVIGATVVATSPASIGQQAVITDGAGAYFIGSLKPGTYEVTAYYADSSYARKNVIVSLGKVSKVNITIDSSAAGEKIVIEGRATIVNQDSSKTGTVITQEYTDNVPTGRTFGAVLGSAAGSQGDTYGTSFGGSTSIENTYIVEGVNTTDPGFGLQTTNLPNEFIRQTEVITGGYEAEYGRSTGGIINVVTKSGSNEFHGSVFAYWTPGSLTADEDGIASASAAIDTESNIGNVFDVGVELGGPIIKDKLWFHVGINPSFSTTDIDRIVKRQVDMDGDGTADVDGNGFGVFEELDRSKRDSSRSTYYYTGKITGAVNQDHQGSLSVLGSPSGRSLYLTAPGEESSRQLDIDRNILDVAVKWSSKFNNSKSQIDVILGYHYDKTDQKNAITEGNDVQYRYADNYFRPLTDFAEFEMADGNPVPTGCTDDPMGGADPYPDIVNCPVRQYRVGGLGFLEDTTASRAIISASFTQRLNLAGQHRIKIGGDLEEQGFDADRGYTGGRFLRERDTSGFWRRRSFYTVKDTATQPCGSDFSDGAGGGPDGIGDARCEEVADSLSVNTKTRNIGAYAQDTWSILPNLTVNLGLRYEQQTLFTGENVQGEISPTTGEPIPEVAFKLGNMFAPRLGVSYDWTQEGRSKVFAHWGRFFESIPQDINVRAYGGEVLNIRFIAPCATTEDQSAGASLSNPICPDEGAENSLLDLYFGGGEELADPDLKAQFLDEIVTGIEYELLPDFKVGASYVRRELGRVIEDISTDGASTYVVANPGDVNESGVQELRDRAAQERMAGTPEGDARADYLEFSADQFANSAIFDRPNRVYNALVVKADKRFSKSFFMTASYTYSKLKGNFPGLFSPETGQLDPNLTSLYDLPDLMANRYGELSADRPHLIKLDGYYTAYAKDVGAFTIGARIRGTSGSPHSTLAAHPLYGGGESYILPRATEVTYTDSAGNERRYGRSPFTTQFDTHIAYKRQLTGTVGIEGFIDIFNLFNQQPETLLDEEYTFDAANPIVGGDSEDLKHLKQLDSNTLVTQNPNFGNTSSRQAPLTMRLGMRLTF